MPRRPPRPVRRMAPVHVVGLAATPFLPEQDAMLDELVFDVTYTALRECGIPVVVVDSHRSLENV